MSAKNETREEKEMRVDQRRGEKKTRQIEKKREEKRSRGRDRTSSHW